MAPTSEEIAVYDDYLDDYKRLKHEAQLFSSMQTLHEHYLHFGGRKRENRQGKDLRGFCIAVGIFGWYSLKSVPCTISRKYKKIKEKQRQTYIILCFLSVSLFRPPYLNVRVRRTEWINTLHVGPSVAAANTSSIPPCRHLVGGKQLPPLFLVAFCSFSYFV